MGQRAALSRRGKHHRPWLIRAAALLAGLLAIGPAPALGQYRVQPGDVLEIDVAGLAGMRQRLPVDTDGTVRVPLIGAVEVDGKSLEEINDLIQTRLASRSLRQMTTGGHEYQLVFEPAQVSVTMAEYRPVYVAGDVARPGQQAFRPGLTVRQAVSLAGGYGMPPSLQQATEPSTQGADLKAELTTLWTEVARDTMRIERINAALAGERTPPQFKIEEIPIEPEIVGELARLETERFLVDVADHDKEAAFLRHGIENSASQIATVTEQQSKERDGLAEDTAELERLAALEKKGNTTANRVTDARRNLLISSTRYLQTTAQIASINREQGDLRRRLDRLHDTRRAQLLVELQDAVARKNATHKRILAAYEKLASTPGSSRQLTLAQAGRPSIVIVRGSANATTKIPAEEDTVLQPGDVVEATLQLPGPPGRRRQAAVE